MACAAVHRLFPHAESRGLAWHAKEYSALTSPGASLWIPIRCQRVFRSIYEFRTYAAASGADLDRLFIVVGQQRLHVSLLLFVISLRYRALTVCFSLVFFLCINANVICPSVDVMYSRLLDSFLLVVILCISILISDFTSRMLSARGVGSHAYSCSVASVHGPLLVLYLCMLGAFWVRYWCLRCTVRLRLVLGLCRLLYIPNVTSVVC